MEIEDGRPVKVRADPDGITHNRYTCVKGRSFPHMITSDRRLLRSVKRSADGTYVALESTEAFDEIAQHLRQIVDKYGPRAVALYSGTKGQQNTLSHPMATAFMRALGSPMIFTSNTIDQPGKPIARALHGTWMAPPQGYDDPDVVLFVGINPLVTYSGVPNGNPNTYLKELRSRGKEIIVIDPRRTGLAKRATQFIQPTPGQDIGLLAAMIRVILDEGLFDKTFVQDNVQGLDSLREGVQPFSPELVATRAGITADEIRRAARTFATAGRGYAVAGTGPSMGTAQSTLIEYLILTLDTLCGHYLRAGETVRNPGTLIPTLPAIAQASPAKPGLAVGAPMRVRGLVGTPAGLPTAALPEEILTSGEGQIRALICLGGNPVSAFPDQLETIEAMKALDLLVTLDIEMSATSQLAHYVIAPTMNLEVPGASLLTDAMLMFATGYKGFADAAARYSPPVVTPPEGADVVEEWEFFYEVARRLGLTVSFQGAFSFSKTAAPPVELNMVTKPTADELLEILLAGSRIPLSEVKRHPHGALFPPDPPVVVQEKERGWNGRLDVGNADMMADLRLAAEKDDLAVALADGFPLRLISRRLNHVVNSSHNLEATNRGRPYNFAYMNPKDMAALGLTDGDVAIIESARSNIPAVFASDENLRAGLISMAHSFGGRPDQDAQMFDIGSPTNRLLTITDVWERYSGQPLMSNFPVRVRVPETRRSAPN
ncbi:anaerobic selenocysteine-containing dehydrogenase [Nocardia kruczakiae]|uniref:Anaerobic selenocysteine-containing dehydrogenase n=1 Tax=Nocardia kruczakiae TaxID=261477 RepID=A0ABU1XB81_9NOCA|nr:anaerobic selenocysteine-containing dehydrogenase [Nocardia kruczakiae]